MRAGLSAPDTEGFIMTLEQIISLVLDCPTLVITDQTKQKDVANWDSFRHISLVMAIEENYRVSLSTEEIQAITSVGDIRKLLLTKGATV